MTAPQRILFERSNSSLCMRMKERVESLRARVDDQIMATQTVTWAIEYGLDERQFERFYALEAEVLAALVAEQEKESQSFKTLSMIEERALQLLSTYMQEFAESSPECQRFMDTQRGNLVSTMRHEVEELFNDTVLLQKLSDERRATNGRRHPSLVTRSESVYPTFKNDTLTFKERTALASMLMEEAVRVKNVGEQQRAQGRDRLAPIYACVEQALASACEELEDRSKHAFTVEELNTLSKRALDEALEDYVLKNLHSAKDMRSALHELLESHMDVAWQHSVKKMREQEQGRNTG